MDLEISEQSLGLVAYDQLLVTPGVLYVPINADPGDYSIVIETTNGDLYTGTFIL